MKGHLRRRGKNSWRLKFDQGRDPATGKRKVQYVTVRGGKREAQAKLHELLVGVDKGQYVEPNKITVGDYVLDRVKQWEIIGRPGEQPISARTAQRYRQLITHQIVPHIGARLLQKLLPHDVEAWHTTVRVSGRVRGEGELSMRTVSHAHKILSAALDDAVRHELVHRNVASLAGC
jgi:integrase